MLDATWIAKTDDRLRVVETQIAVHERDIQGVKDDLRVIKSNTTWLLRLIVGSLVFGVLGLLIKGGF
jgi:hypothetical protein